VHEVIEKVLRPVLGEERLAIRSFGGNLAVCGTWNRIIEQAESTKDAEYMVITNDDVAFLPGELAKLPEFMMQENQELHKQQRLAEPYFGLLTFQWGGTYWSAFVVNKKMIAAVGTFDENLYPLYYEDNEYEQRMQVCTCHGKRNDELQKRRERR
jgi:GT2 family glycosyltransferase